jgi:membrane protein
MIPVKLSRVIDAIAALLNAGGASSRASSGPAHPGHPALQLFALTIMGVGAFFVGTRVGEALGLVSNRAAGSMGSRAIDLARAAEPARGREALFPNHIPWQGWKDILIRSYLGFSQHRLLALAAGVAFYDLLAIFPAVTALVSVYGLFADSNQAEHDFSGLLTVVPAGVVDVVREQIDRIVHKGTGSLSLTFVGGLALSLWSANAGLKALFDALNVIYDETETRGLVKLNVVSMIFTAGVIGFALLSVGGVVALAPILAHLGIDHLSKTLLSLSNWGALFLAATAGLSALYRFGPSRRPAKWRWLTVGSVTGALSWLLGSAAFSWYLVKFADFGVTYGSLGAAIGLMMWLWLTAIAVLLGGQLNAEIEHQTARDSTVGEDRPLGWRGAAMADTVGKAQIRNAR